jgi:hypothetical protein
MADGYLRYELPNQKRGTTRVGRMSANGGKRVTSKFVSKIAEEGRSIVCNKKLRERQAVTSTLVDA